LLSNEGFSLVETVVSILLLSIIVMGFFSLYINVKKINTLVEQKRLAFQLCQDILFQINKGNIEIKASHQSYYSCDFNKLYIDNCNLYKFIDKLEIELERLKIEEEIYEKLFLTSFDVFWSDQTFHLKTILKGGG